MNSSLVYDGKTLNIPESMGCPSAGQLTGTVLENLGELASRICYDSLGSGRTSEKLHQHILEVRNHSVYEHCVLTICFGNIHDEMIIPFLNRKGVWLENNWNRLEVTINFRAILEWERHTGGINVNHFTKEFGSILRHHAHQHAPLIFEQGTPSDYTHIKETELTDDQAWISLWLYGSRGFSHEMVRHRYSMSQRSTRYVDEDKSPYIQHPLITQYLNDAAVSFDKRLDITARIDQSMEKDRETYISLVNELQTYGLVKGLDKQTARKQARGAARGYLGNALATEMIYSAPVSGWKWILNQRKNRLADAEIREICTPALAALQNSQYGDRFDMYKLEPSPDGLGTVLCA